jgi:hypothetical protein
MVPAASLANLKPFEKGDQRFKERAMHTTKHPEGYLTSRLKRLLKKKIYPYNNPLTNTTEKLEGGQAAALATIWAALQGDMRAMEILLDRIDGKVEQKLVGEGFENKVINIIHNNGKPEENLITKIRNQSPAVSE